MSSNEVEVGAQALLVYWYDSYHYIYWLSVLKWLITAVTCQKLALTETKKYPILPCYYRFDSDPTFVVLMLPTWQSLLPLVMVNRLMWRTCCFHVFWWLIFLVKPVYYSTIYSMNCTKRLTPVCAFTSRLCQQQVTSNGSWCMGIKGEMSGTVCVTFTWYMYIYELFIAFVCFVVSSLL